MAVRRRNNDLTQQKEIHLTKRSVTDNDDITTLLSKVVMQSNVLEVLNLRDNSIALAANIITQIGDHDDDDGEKKEEEEGKVGEPLMKMMDIPPPPFPTFTDDGDEYDENDLIRSSNSNEKEDEQQSTTTTDIQSKIEPIKKREQYNNNTTATTEDTITKNNNNNNNNALTIALSNSTTLIELDLQDNQISVEGCQNLSKALSNNKSIRILKLGGNKIGDEGLNHLCDAFVASGTTANNSNSNTTLQHLDLCNNLFGNGFGATKLVTSVLLSNEEEDRNSSLISLDLSYNTIGDSTITKLSNSLCCCATTLQELNLSYNRITNEGGISLANALSKNNTLKKLWINGNNIGDDGMNKFCDTLGCRKKKKKNGDGGSNTSLIEFWFNGNPISVKVYMTLLVVLDERKKARGE